MRFIIPTPKTYSTKKVDLSEEVVKFVTVTKKTISLEQEIELQRNIKDASNLINNNSNIFEDFKGDLNQLFNLILTKYNNDYDPLPFVALLNSTFSLSNLTFLNVVDILKKLKWYSLSTGRKFEYLKQFQNSPISERVSIEFLENLKSQKTIKNLNPILSILPILNVETRSEIIAKFLLKSSNSFAIGEVSKPFQQKFQTFIDTNKKIIDNNLYFIISEEPVKVESKIINLVDELKDIWSKFPVTERVAFCTELINISKLLTICSNVIGQLKLNFAKQYQTVEVKEVKKSVNTKVKAKNIGKIHSARYEDDYDEEDFKNALNTKFKAEIEGKIQSTHRDEDDEDYDEDY